MDLEQLCYKHSRLARVEILRQFFVNPRASQLMTNEKSISTKPKRRRGGQPGNLNALKHGFYSRSFRKFEIDDLGVTSVTDLAGEINALRISTRRLIELSADNTDTEIGIKLLSTLSLALVRLSNLLRAQVRINAGLESEAFESIGKGLTEKKKELWEK